MKMPGHVMWLCPQCQASVRVPIESTTSDKGRSMSIRYRADTHFHPIPHEVAHAVWVKAMEQAGGELLTSFDIFPT